MIKNIVFDLGNVLISYRPAEFLDKCGYKEPLKSTILNDIFNSRQWLMLDNDELTTEEAIDQIISESSLPGDLIREIFDRRAEILIPISPNIRLLPELKKLGFRLFYLSNFPRDLWNQIHNGEGKYNYDFFVHFEDGLISADARCSKPDPKIYRLFFEKFSINPEECFYLDDLPANVDGAARAGMHAVVTHGTHELYEEVMMRFSEGR